MGRFLATADGRDHVSGIRHVALCLAALTAYLLRHELHVGNSVLWIIGVAGALNVQAFLLAGRPKLRNAARSLSFACGISGWTLLVYLTGGVSSPFVAGLWIEIFLSAISPSAIGPVLVTLSSIGALWGQQLVLGYQGVMLPLLLHTGFLAGFGWVTVVLKLRWTRSHDALRDSHGELRSRLRRLENELNQVRALGEVGENVARLAHALKNAVHSLRGFAKLIEPHLSDSQVERRVIAGLRTSIDRLDQIARETLRPAGSPSTSESLSSGAETCRLIDEVARDVARSHGAINCIRDVAGPLPSAAIPPQQMREILTILIRNAAEAMNGSGDVEVSAATDNGALRIRVRDHGPGLDRDSMRKLCEPGYTTKPEGSGFGLLLARRILESHGGNLVAASSRGGGAAFTVQIPLQRA
jgi:signal transduction histidine kinase